MERRRPVGRHRQQNKETALPRKEVERGDPRGKPFVMVHAGHQTEDTPTIPELIRIVEGQVLQLETGQKVFLYLEDFAGHEIITKRAKQLMGRGMTYTDAMAEIEYESMKKRQRGPEHRKPEKIREIKERQLRQADPHEQEIGAALDNILSVQELGNKIIVHFEHQPDEVVAANRQFYQELTTRFPDGASEEEIIGARREQLSRWADGQDQRETNIGTQIIDGMSRVDVGAGVSFLGAWHHGGVDPKLREALAPKDDPEASNVTSLFPETRYVSQSHGEVDYPVDPELALMRDLMNGQEVGDLDILLAYQAGQMDFSGGRTATQAILDEAADNADHFFSTDETPTEEMLEVHPEDVHADDSPTEPLGMIPPQVEGARQARQRQCWVELQKGMLTKTQPLNAVKERAQHEVEESIREQAQPDQDEPGSGTSELRVPDQDVRVTVTPPEIAALDDEMVSRYFADGADIAETDLRPSTGDIFSIYGLDKPGSQDVPQQEASDVQHPPTQTPPEIEE